MARLDDAQKVMDSHLLSKLMSEVGIHRRRWTQRKQESDMMNTCASYRSLCEDSIRKVPLHIGSSAEGVAADFLGSDTDVMHIILGTRVIEGNTYSEDDPDHIYQTVRTRHSAHVRLRLLHIGNSRNERNFPTSRYCVVDEEGSLVLHGTELVRNTGWCTGEEVIHTITHGPAQTMSFPEMYSRNTPTDVVLGLHCQNWPSASEEWVHRQRRFNWPTPGLISAIIEHGCDLVAVGYPESTHRELEWRLSHSLAERTLIRSLNIVQIQCYFLLKLVLTYWIKAYVPNVISSYHLKNIILHVVENTDPREWRVDNLTICLMTCFQTFLLYLELGYLPQYFIPTHNLLRPKIQGETRRKILDIIRQLYSEGWRCVLACAPLTNIDIPCDHQGTMCPCFTSFWEQKTFCQDVASILAIFQTIYETSHWLLSACTKAAFNDTLKGLLQVISPNRELYFPSSVAVALTKRLLSCHIGYMLLNVMRRQPLGSNRGVWEIMKVSRYLLEENCGVDLTSCRLKLATVYYQTGQVNKCIQTVQENVGQFKEEETVPVCANDFRMLRYREHPRLIAVMRKFRHLFGNIEGLLRHVAFPVAFSSWEIASAPPAVQGLLLTSEPSLSRDPDNPTFIHIDALVYCYFLLVVSFLDEENIFEVRRSLDNMRRVVADPWRHMLFYPETAQALLVQCDRDYSTYMAHHQRFETLYNRERYVEQSTDAKTRPSVGEEEAQQQADQTETPPSSNVQTAEKEKRECVADTLTQPKDIEASSTEHTEGLDSDICQTIRQDNVRELPTEAEECVQPVNENKPTNNQTTLVESTSERNTTSTEVEKRVDTCNRRDKVITNLIEDEAISRVFGANIYSWIAGYRPTVSLNIILTDQAIVMEDLHQPAIENPQPVPRLGVTTEPENSANELSTTTSYITSQENIDDQNGTAAEGIPNPFDALVAVYAQMKDALSRGKALAIAADLYQLTKGTFTREEIAALYRTNNRRDIVDSLLKRVLKSPYSTYQRFFTSLAKHEKGLADCLQRKTPSERDIEVKSVLSRRRTAETMQHKADDNEKQRLHQHLSSMLVLDAAIDQLLSLFYITVDEHEEIRSAGNVAMCVDHLLDHFKNYPYLVKPFVSILKSVGLTPDKSKPGGTVVTFTLNLPERQMEIRLKNVLQSEYGSNQFMERLQYVGDFKTVNVEDGSVKVRIAPCNAESFVQLERIKNSGKMKEFLATHIAALLDISDEIDFVLETVVDVGSSTDRTAEILNADISIEGDTNVYELCNVPCLKLGEEPRSFEEDTEYTEHVGKLVLCHDSTNVKFGRTSIIYDGYDNFFEITYTIKRIPRVKTPTGSYDDRETIHEIVKSRLMHKNIIKYFRIEKDKEYVYVAMEQCDMNLQEYIDSHVPSGNGDKELYIMKQIARGVCHMHENGLIHNKIQPSSILCRERSPADQIEIKLGSFSNTQVADTGCQIVTAETRVDNWTANEILSAIEKMKTDGPTFQSKELSYASDVASTAYVYYFIATNGHHPFDQQRNSSSRPDLSNIDSKYFDLPVLLDSMLEALPENRPTMRRVLRHPAHLFHIDKNDFLVAAKLVEKTNNVDFNIGNKTKTNNSQLVSIANPWLSRARLSHVVFNYLVTQTKTTYTPWCINDLTRAFRNCYVHFSELPAYVQAEFKASGYLHYWLTRFPGLLTTVHNSMNVHSSEPELQKYYKE